MIGDQDDTQEKNYFTFWEYSTEKFMDQTCTVRRNIGKDDIGKIKIQPNVAYNVYLGAKIFVSKGASGMRRAADAAEPVTMKVAFEVEQAPEKTNEKDASVSLFASGVSFALLLSCLLAF